MTLKEARAGETPERQSESDAATGTLIARVRQAYDAMPPAERRVADLILYFPGELPGYSASELARLAKTSNAAVSRFVRRLNFASFEEMRLLARQERENGSPVTLMRLHDDAGGKQAHDLSRHVEAVAENLRRTIAGIDQTTWTTLIDAVAIAPRVWINGFRHGFHLAGYLKWSLGHVRGNVALIPGPGETFGESLVDAQAGDVAILFAMRRRVPATTRLARALRAIGVRVALVTDGGMTDSLGAEFVLRCQSGLRGATDDHASAFVLAHALIEGLIHHLGPSARERFTAVDARHEALSEFG